jgi:hypothetical protein
MRSGPAPCQGRSGIPAHALDEAQDRATRFGIVNDQLHLIQCARSANTVRVIHEQSTTFRLYISSVECARLETALLKDVTDDYYYGCSCQSCLHSARLSLSRLRAHLGGDYPFAKIRDRLKCEICSSRKVTITFLGPHQKGGNLQHLFEKEPR